jgi:nitroreductase
MSIPMDSSQAELAQSSPSKRPAAIDTMISRQSHFPLRDPGPSDEELEQIFDAALRAPDHGRLRPWRFALIRGEARTELAEVLIDIAASRAHEASSERDERQRRKAFAAPVIIVLGAAIASATSIPESEQMLSVGAATMNMLNAIHALGYGGFWATGNDAYDEALQSALDFEPTDKILGFLFVGTPQVAESPAPRPVRSDHVREWLGRSSI